MNKTSTFLYQIIIPALFNSINFVTSYFYMHKNKEQLF